MKTLEDSFPLVITRDALIVSHEGSQYVVAWTQCYRADELPPSFQVGSFLIVLNLDGTVVRSSIDREIKMKAMDFRVKQIQEELGISGEVRDMDVIAQILDRVWAGEWMGQFNEAKVIYFNELGDILNLSMREMMDVVPDLVEKRLADVLESSYILDVPRKRKPLHPNRERSGHKKYYGSEFGFWTCMECHTSGDDWSDPADFPCISES